MELLIIITIIVLALGICGVVDKIRYIFGRDTK